MFSKSATNRRDDGIATVIFEYCPKLLAARNSETLYIQFLQDLPDFSYAQREIRLFNRLFSIAANLDQYRPTLFH